jgi:RHS repeat-associated protein
MTEMPHLPLMAWDFQDRLRETRRQVVNHGAPEATRYVYDAAGQRVRTITLRQDGSRRCERYYIGGFEVFREYQAGRIERQRETLHVMDDIRRIALIETETVERGRPAALPESVSRYQFANHLGSASLELDGTGGFLTYEEYSPYGNSTFQAGGAAEVSLKRYRYTGKERDEENGFTYHGARYYAPWLGRWTACDPAELQGGVSRYAYVNNRPIIANDPNGRWLNILIGAAVGLLVGGGVELARQAIKGEKIDWGRVGSAALGGAVGGAIAGATFGGSLLVEGAGVAVGGAVGGLVTKAVNREPITPTGVAWDVGISLATWGILRGGGAVIGRAVSRGAGSAGEGAGEGLGAGTGPAAPKVPEVSGGQGSNPLKPGQVESIADAFQKRFGQPPKNIKIIGSHAEGAAEASSDIDISIETEIQDLTKHTGEGFEFFKDVNPGRVPPDITGIGSKPGEGFIGDAIPKPGTIDPFFKAPGETHPPSVQVWPPSGVPAAPPAAARPDPKVLAPIFGAGTRVDKPQSNPPDRAGVVIFEW